MSNPPRKRAMTGSPIQCILPRPHPLHLTSRPTPSLERAHLPPPPASILAPHVSSLAPKRCSPQRLPAGHLSGRVHRPARLRHGGAAAADVCPRFRHGSERLGNCPVDGQLFGHAIHFRPGLGTALRPDRPAARADGWAGRLGAVLHAVRRGDDLAKFVLAVRVADRGRNRRGDDHHGPSIHCRHHYARKPRQGDDARRRGLRTRLRHRAAAGRIRASRGAGRACDRAQQSVSRSEATERRSPSGAATAADRRQCRHCGRNQSTTLVPGLAIWRPRCRHSRWCSRISSCRNRSTEPVRRRRGIRSTIARCKMRCARPPSGRCW